MRVKDKSPKNNEKETKEKGNEENRSKRRSAVHEDPYCSRERRKRKRWASGRKRRACDCMGGESTSVVCLLLTGYWIKKSTAHNMS